MGWMVEPSDVWEEEGWEGGFLGLEVELRSRGKKRVAPFIPLA